MVQSVSQQHNNYKTTSSVDCGQTKKMLNHDARDANNNILQTTTNNNYKINIIIWLNKLQNTDNQSKSIMNLKGSRI